MMPINAPLVRCEHLSKSFSMDHMERHVLREAEFQICPGETVLLFGKSGQGKSVLLSLLCGLDKPTMGDIYFDGIWYSSCTQKQLAEIRRKHIGIIFQNLNLIPSWTAVENVAAALEDFVPSANIRNARARQLLEEMDLADRLHHLPAELSMGEQQRVAIARTLIREPKFILADEPTGDLDAVAAGQIVHLLRTYIHHTNSTMLIATHGVFPAMNCDRILNITGGVLTQLVRIKSEPMWKVMS